MVEGEFWQDRQNENLWSVCSHADYALEARSFDYEKISVFNFRIEFESFSSGSQSPKGKDYVINIDRSRTYVLVVTPRATDKTLIYRKP